jgi:glycosyltransferase involved in cell wall biosynthesis
MRIAFYAPFKPLDHPHPSGNQMIGRGIFSFLEDRGHQPLRINESLGMVFLEAQACGLPVVACNNGGIPEVVVNRKTGLLTSLEEETALDQALLQLLTNPEQRKKMGRAAARYVRDEHDINRNYRQLEQILVQTASRVTRE